MFGIMQTGDIISCDVERRTLELRINEEKIKTRLLTRAGYVVSKEGRKNSAAVLVGREKRRGYRGLYERCVN